MQRIVTAFRAFFVVLFNGPTETKVRLLLTSDVPPTPDPDDQPKKLKKHEKPKKPPKRPVRSEAVTLLATLQRESRLIDFLQEPIDDYSDAQIGAAVRDVHRDCSAAIQRMFAIEPILEQEEGSRVEVPEHFDAGRYSLVGNISGDPPFHGQLVHQGWRTTRCEMPIWTGSEQATSVITPVEVEVS